MPDGSDEHGTDSTAAPGGGHAARVRRVLTVGIVAMAQEQFSLHGDSCVKYNIYLFGQSWFSAMGSTLVACRGMMVIGIEMNGGVMVGLRCGCSGELFKHKSTLG